MAMELQLSLALPCSMFGTQRQRWELYKVHPMQL
jgi:hypothetical protein